MLLVTDLFHPVDGISVELFVNGDVHHGRGCRGTRPMLSPGDNQLTSPERIYQAAASGHDQGLAERVDCATLFERWAQISEFPHLIVTLVCLAFVVCGRPHLETIRDKLWSEPRYSELLLIGAIPLHFTNHCPGQGSELQTPGIWRLNL